jgi:hypothetical protein
MSIEDRNLKPGTVLVARYKKRNHRCEVVKGAEGKVAFRVGGKEYGSPSGGGERRDGRHGVQRLALLDSGGRGEGRTEARHAHHDG